MYRLTLIGHYCATGGISIHIKRLERLLKNALFAVNIIDESRREDHNGDVYNIRKDGLFRYLEIINSSDIIHIHTSIPELRLFHVIVSKLFFKRVIVTFHSLSLIRNFWQVFLAKLCVFISDRIIVVNPDMIAELNLKLNKVHVLPAFIPPVMDLEPLLPENVNGYFQMNYEKILVCNAFRLNFFKGDDLYGVDLLIDVARQFKKHGNNYLIICVITNIDVNRDVYTHYLECIMKEDLSKHLIFITSPLSFVRLIALSDLVLRPTNTDGDAITVREALYLGKPVIASDVIKRPKGTVVFKNRDSNDLYFKILEVLKSPQLVSNYEKVNYLELYKAIYS